MTDLTSVSIETTSGTLTLDYLEDSGLTFTATSTPGSGTRTGRRPPWIPTWQKIWSPPSPA